MDSPREDFDVPTTVGPHDLLDASSDAAAVLSAEGDVIGWTRGASDDSGDSGSGGSSQPFAG
ncbi:hypothetical protein, partial [Streptomyces sp. NPDC001833]|uniref:hypothetical protein n=1 Tax=Streptomyces sp. NPDC001833 TaxID=3154658 RepID=UPI0033167B64